MDYYTCKNCGWYFSKPSHIILRWCPNCKENQHLCKIDKQTCLNWLDVYKYSQLYQEYQTEKHFDRMYNICCMVWEHYEKTNIERNKRF